MSGLRRTAERSPPQNFHITPDFGLMGWQKVILSPECIPPDLHRSPFCGRGNASTDGSGTVPLPVSVTEPVSADEAQTGFRSMASSRSGSIFMVRMSGISDGITRMVTEITFLLLLMFPESDDSAGEHAAPLRTIATGGITADLNGTVHGMTGQHPGRTSRQTIHHQRHHDGGRQRMCGRTYPPSKRRQIPVSHLSNRYH